MNLTHTFIVGNALFKNFNTAQLFQDADESYTLSKISEILCSLFSVYKQDFFPYFDVLLQQYVLLLVSVVARYIIFFHLL